MVSIEQRVEKYRQSLLSQQPRPKLTEREKAQRLEEQLRKTEVQLEKADHRRIMLLSRALQVAAKQEDYAAVHGYAAEIALLARTRVLGVQAAHPVLSTLPPQARPPSLPTIDVEADDEPA